MSHLTFDSNDGSGYDQILNRVRHLTTALQGAIDSRRGGQPQQHHASLAELHNRTRGIAAVLNQALGTWHQSDDQQWSTSQRAHTGGHLMDDAG